MDDETLAECFYEAVMRGKYDDTAVDLLRGEVQAGELAPAERENALRALETLARSPGDAEAIQVLFEIFRNREEFIQRMAEKFTITLAGDGTT